MAWKSNDDDEEIQEELCQILVKLKRQVIRRRAVIAWERSPEPFGEEIVSLNDIDEAIGNNCAKR